MSQNRAASTGRSAAKAAVGQSATTSEGLSVTRRLQQELMALMTGGDQSISAFPIGDSLLRWRGTIKGPVGTVYEGLSFKLRLDFPNNYPFAAPHVWFETPCFHPNVAEKEGEICLDILKEKWSALYDVRTILLSIQSLLAEPNNESPLNGIAARMWSNKSEYKAMLLRKYDESATTRRP